MSLILKLSPSFMLGKCRCQMSEEIPIRNKKGKLQTYLHGHNTPNGPNWKGGRRLRRQYVTVLIPDHPFADRDGYVREHRLVIERHLNAILLPWIHVHHKNGDTRDNRLENLEPLTNSQHRSLHSRGNRYTLGKHWTWKKNKPIEAKEK